MFTFILLISALKVAAEPAPMFQRASNLLEDRYLWLDKVDVVEGCTAAAEESFVQSNKTQEHHHTTMGGEVSKEVRNAADKAAQMSPTRICTRL